MTRASHSLLGLALGLVAACGDAAPAGHVDLTARLVPVGEPLRTVRTEDRSFELEEQADGRWLCTDVQRADWRFDADFRGGVWRASIQASSAGRPRDGSSEQRLEAPGTTFRHAPPSDDPSIPWRLEVGCFAATDRSLVLRLAPGAEPPASARLRLFAGRSVGADDEPRIGGRRFSGRGVAVRAGEARACSVDVPPDAALRFGTTVEPALGGQRNPISFRVLADGELLFEHVERDPGASAYAWHAVPLSSGRTTLRFEVSGSFAHSAFFTPSVGPARAEGARLEGGRPDLIVFLADTFRADSMAVYGGELGLTPNLDAFAAAGRVHRRAWSTGTFTLPAHASMFTGAFPHQVGIVGTEHGIPEALVTVAEHLAAHGYRTGAITDSVVVTNELGMGQGFEWFDELHGTLGSTRERARDFLAADDGRPVFLFVQTYRTHLPYRVTRETRAEWGERLGIEGSPDALRARLQGLVESAPDAPGRQESIARVLEKLQAHYRGGVVDLDKGFAAFRRDLTELGLDDAVLVFASDHGEAFGENGAIYHRDKVWEVLARIPLVLHGPGIEPQVVEHAASLVDLPMTLADLAGIPPHPSWLGRSLLNLDGDRPAFVFECRRVDDSTLAVVDGPRKVIGYEDRERLAAGELLGGFRLDRDPDEQADVRAEGESWPDELFERMRPTLLHLLEPRVDAADAHLSAERLEELRAMGYGGD